MSAELLAFFFRVVSWPNLFFPEIIQRDLLLWRENEALAILLLCNSFNWRWCRRLSSFLDFAPVVDSPHSASSSPA
jgi:hypothetical protein